MPYTYILVKFGVKTRKQIAESGVVVAKKDELNETIANLQKTGYYIIKVVESKKPKKIVVNGNKVHIVKPTFLPDYEIPDDSDVLVVKYGVDEFNYDMGVLVIEKTRLEETLDILNKKFGYDTLRVVKLAKPVFIYRGDKKLHIKYLHLNDR